MSSRNLSVNHELHKSLHVNGSETIQLIHRGETTQGTKPLAHNNAIVRPYVTCFKIGAKPLGANRNRYETTRGRPHDVNTGWPRPKLFLILFFPL